MAGTSHPGDRYGLVDGSLDARAGSVCGLPLLVGLLEAGVGEEFSQLAGLQGEGPALALRSRIVLACAEIDGDGLPRSASAIARELGITTQTVSKWRARFLRHRLDGMGDATHWSTRSMAAKTGLSQSTVSRIWRAFGLQPHRAETFKLSTDPFFIDKVHDVVGLYLDPPERALVLCVDEKSQIQALDRSQPVLPMMPGVPERASHDYLRAGTTTLFAALDAAMGKVIGSLHRRHRAAEFRKFLSKLDREIPAGLNVHLICDNYVTHKTESVRRWLLAHPRFQLHFTPTGSSWLNLVERWFAELTNKKLRRGVHRSVQALERDIRNWIATWNDNPRPYVWTKTADQILESLAAYRRRINDSGH